MCIYTTHNKHEYYNVSIIIIINNNDDIIITTIIIIIIIIVFMMYDTLVPVSVRQRELGGTLVVHVMHVTYVWYVGIVHGTRR